MGKCQSAAVIRVIPQLGLRGEAGSTRPIGRRPPRLRPTERRSHVRVDPPHRRRPARRPHRWGTVPSSLGLSAAEEASPAATLTSCLPPAKRKRGIAPSTVAEGWGKPISSSWTQGRPTTHRHRRPGVGREYPAHGVRHARPAAYAEGIQVCVPSSRTAGHDRGRYRGRGSVAMRTTFAGTQADPIENLDAPNTGDPWRLRRGCSRGWSAARWPRCGSWPTT